MMYKIGFTSTFKRQYKRFENNSKIKLEISTVMEYFLQGKRLPYKYKNHKLQGILRRYRELHLAPDVLIVYEVDDKEQKITFTQIGSHSNLFK